MKYRDIKNKTILNNTLNILKSKDGANSKVSSFLHSISNLSDEEQIIILNDIIGGFYSNIKSDIDTKDKDVVLPKLGTLKFNKVKKLATDIYFDMSKNEDLTIDECRDNIKDILKIKLSSDKAELRKPNVIFKQSITNICINNDK